MEFCFKVTAYSTSFSYVRYKVSDINLTSF